ncbi:MAG: hypothetical protein EPO24_02110 [Bacteroidetes bacterium]|nr:MAG: hypothetical protein EPO24_02110 [Bacteroidota bacterium]
METFKTETVITKEGTLFLNGLPYKEGEKVEVPTIPSTERNEIEKEKYPLQGTPLRYDNPFDSVAEEDWEVLK